MAEEERAGMIPRYTVRISKNIPGFYEVWDNQTRRKVGISWMSYEAAQLEANKLNG